MSISLDTVQKNAVLKWWYYDTEAMGAQLCFGRVVKIGAKKIKIRDEWGRESWKYPWWFDGIVSEMVIGDLLD